MEVNLNEESACGLLMYSIAPPPDCGGMGCSSYFKRGRFAIRCRKTGEGSFGKIATLHLRRTIFIGQPLRLSAAPPCQVEG